MALKDKVPEEVFTGERVDLSNLKVFGCRAQVLVKDHSRKKFDAKTVQMIMTGYSTNSKAYRFINLEDDPTRIIIARDATFMENVSAATKEKQKAAVPVSKKDAVVIDLQYDIPGVSRSITQPEVPRIADPVAVRIPVASSNMNEEESGSVSSTTRASSPTRSDSGENFYDSVDVEDPTAEDLQSSASVDLEHPVAEGLESSRRYPARNRVPKREKDMVYNFHVSDDPDPISVKDAMERSDKKFWVEAMKDEFNSLKVNGTWELVDRPLDANVVKTKWVFKLKVGADGSTQRYKARLVAKGYSQKPGEDYFETFAPVVKMSSIRLLLALTVEKNLSVHHIDVTTAFLNGDLCEEIYMEQPQSFVQEGSEGKVCKLKKAIYGLKQAARCWNQKIHEHIMKMGFSRSKYDQCVYTKNYKDIFTVIALYVDDFYIFTNKAVESRTVIRQIGRSFKIKDLGEARECLGVRIERKSVNEIHLSQKQYISKILEKYGMLECKAVSTPVEMNLRLKSGEKNDNTRYQEIIGSLMYLACCTRPDISYAVTMLSQFNNCNDSTHMAALKRVLRYLKGTAELSLCYKKCNKPLVAYADADWGNGPDGKSFSGYTLVFGGAAVSWQSIKQRCVALSTAEAEYIAICEVAKEVISVNGLYSELTGRNNTAVTIFSDSQSASKLVYSPAIGKRSKHINIRYHFVRELAEQRVICVKYCETALMPADMMTKGVGKQKHVFCTQHSGLSGGVEP
ncbi:hypothetical protein PYW07_016022 [Mythimna separata]|uniref:Reverse transcriptase Ty1/copia-type domain-containing protein n=1 Tax=Mythimna separata TaxID=271217 RepID=A0AAD8DUZ3_MYTSE|nr:hypothetical protein PYW07_016022 [Mythimna separata]